MQILNAILLGIIQGLTEFLPISSSGHLVLFQHFFQKGNSLNSDISLEVFLHLGSLFAVVLYFRKDIRELILSLFCWNKTVDSNKHLRNRMVILYLIVSTIVTGLVYLLFGKVIKSIFANPLATALLLSASGFILIASDLQKITEIPVSGMGFIRGIIIGLGQGISMLPGISRSGTTIATSLFCGLKRSEAARFSFLLSIPAILVANVTEFNTITNLTTYQLISYVFGALAAFASGYLVIEFLIRLIQASKLKYFAYYCWLISSVSIIFIIGKL